MPDSATVPSSTDVLIVGAGLSGLACAQSLARAGVDFHLVEASDDVGGRIRTDEVDGFRLDRGFQVLLTAYDELRSAVDLERLDLRPFLSGSAIWTGEKLVTMADPIRHPRLALNSTRVRIGRLSDKLKVASLRRRLLGDSAEATFRGPERTTQAELEALGFSHDFIDRFFRPFFGGVFLERSLKTSSSLFRYYFRCFAAGDAAVPAKGMQQLPLEMAHSVRPHLTLGCAVRDTCSDGVTLDDGTRVQAKSVVVATDGSSAARLLGRQAPEFKSTVTSYFAAPKSPLPHPFLILDGEGSGPVNHVAVMSEVAPEYAPEGHHLVSVSGVDGVADDPEKFRSDALPQLRRWFGPGANVERWQHLRTYHVDRALPAHPPGSLARTYEASASIGLITAGDYTEFGAIQGALRSGRRAAAEVMRRAAA